MRWQIKKAARVGVTIGSWASGSVAIRRLIASGPRVRALTYHRFGNVRRDPFCVTREDFDAQIRTLAEQKRAISLDQLNQFIAGAISLPPDSCLVTIDDGMISTLTEALPILDRWQVPAIAFVTSSLVGREIDGLPERYMTWAELRRLAGSGLVRIGSHAHTHRSLGLMPIDAARTEAIQSRDAIQREIAQSVDSFAYPFGTRTDFNSHTDRVLLDAGYKTIFNSMHGVISPGEKHGSLPRIKIEGGESPYIVSLINRGGLDAWRLVDQTLWKFQRVRAEIQ